MELLEGGFLSPETEPLAAGVLARLVRPIAEGVRRSLRTDAGGRPEDPSAPGMLLLAADDEIELITPPAERLLAPLRGTGPMARPSARCRCSPWPAPPAGTGGAGGPRRPCTSPPAGAG